ncbi:hypothetical protein GCM10011583_48500 [Streptomyces camponoticapitis]|uniref:Uncharacterized protein n=1 Tax=Streptomyces camponoticapitis TaxID=1616125 RepID=A0ABQ2EFL4_9ACTN|nr:hypothetical protein [Streptomyces camponoticapitis]GGK10685.1 hypothetical protein GCM10011583_48500 [Streptomyces camponoticapitis]
MPIDPFAVLNALLRAEAARSSEHEAKAPTTSSTAPAPPPARPSEPRGDARDRS